MTVLHPEPGEEPDLSLGFPGPASPLPDDLPDFPTEINDPEEDDDDADEDEAEAADH